MSARRAACAAALLVLLAADPLALQRHVYRSSDDDYIKLGTRMPPLPPGEGGQLLVSVPAPLCDGRHALELRHQPSGSPGYPVLRIAADRPCRWQVDDLPAGDYVATIEIGAEARVVATARGHLFKGGAQAMALLTLSTEIAGAVRVNGSPPPPGLDLMFRNEKRLWLEWPAVIDADGAYRVAIETPVAGERTCLYFQRTPPINAVGRGCHEFRDGLQHLDVETTLPRGVLRIDVAPVPDAAPAAFARITISGDSALGTYLTSFKLVRGFRGDYIAEVDRDYQIVVSRHADLVELATARVPLTALRPEARVRLLPDPALARPH